MRELNTHICVHSTLITTPCVTQASVTYTCCRKRARTDTHCEYTEHQQWLKHCANEDSGLPRCVGGSAVPDVSKDRGAEQWRHDPSKRR